VGIGNPNAASYYVVRIIKFPERRNELAKLRAEIEEMNRKLSVRVEAVCYASAPSRIQISIPMQGSIARSACNAWGSAGHSGAVCRAAEQRRLLPGLARVETENIGPAIKAERHHITDDGRKVIDE
jgi:hypothetical protein